MGLLQKAVETYDANEQRVGVKENDCQPLAPISHIITNADIEITLDEQGGFVGASLIEKANAKTMIPATEDSAGRTSAPCPHPLCEQIGYLSGQTEKKYTLYVEQLQSWTDSPDTHPMLQPILTYVKGKTLLEDLEKCGIKKTSEKQFVRWRVLGIGEESGPCWTNQALFRSFMNWYQQLQMQSDNPKMLCMISGEKTVLAKQHPKGIIPFDGNAKLISSNDSSNFTYRGRFTEDWQAATVGYLASQKAHNALRWLAANQSVSVVYGGRTFLCWNPQGKRVPHSNLPLQDEDFSTAAAATTPTNYQRELKRTLEGYRSELPKGSGVVIAAFDAATTGRLAVTYYRELLASDFLQRLYDWEMTCRWWGWNPETRRNDAIQSPPLWRIINAAFGTQRVEKDKARLVTDDRVMRQQMQRLLACRVDKARFPTDIERMLVNRASEPQAFDQMVYRNLLAITCAVVRKYYFDVKKEELSMTLEKDRADLSYQFGRLLAVLEKAERDTYDKDTSREPNAIRLQSVYCRRPLHFANIIESRLEQAYFPRLKPGSRRFYKDLIQEIIELITEQAGNDKAVLNRPLGDTYLLGYYLQRAELYRKKEQNEAKEEQEEI